MNRTELIERVRTAYHTAGSSTPSGSEALIDFAIRSAFREILRALKSGEAVTIHGFGSWTVQTQVERPRFNVNTRQIHAARPRERIRFNLARSNPMAKIADDPFAMPSEFKTADDLMKWLMTAAGSIQTWKDKEKAVAAWSDTRDFQSRLLSADQRCCRRNATGSRPIRRASTAGDA
jgi:nucleoid DNA-binding protein